MTFNRDPAEIGLIRGQNKSILNPKGKGYFVSISHFSLKPKRGAGTLSRTYTYSLTSTGHKDNPDCFVNTTLPKTSGCGTKKLDTDATIDVLNARLVAIPFGAHDPFDGCPNEAEGNFAVANLPDASVKQLANPEVDRSSSRGASRCAIPGRRSSSRTVIEGVRRSPRRGISCSKGSRQPGRAGRNAAPTATLD